MYKKKACTRAEFDENSFSNCITSRLQIFCLFVSKEHPDILPAYLHSLNGWMILRCLFYSSIEDSTKCYR